MGGGGYSDALPPYKEFFFPLPQIFFCQIIQEKGLHVRCRHKGKQHTQVYICVIDQA